MAVEGRELLLFLTIAENLPVTTMLLGLLLVVGVLVGEGVGSRIGKELGEEWFRRMLAVLVVLVLVVLVEEVVVRVGGWTSWLSSCVIFTTLPPLSEDMGGVEGGVPGGVERQI